MLLFAIVGIVAISVVALCSFQAYALQRANRRMQAELRLARELEERNQLMFANNPSPMWVYEHDTLRFLDVNDAAVRAYGFSREEFLQMTLRDIRFPEDVPALEHHLSQHHSGVNAGGIWRHRRKNGTLLFVEIRAFGFKEGGSRGELVQAIDVSERILVERALRQSQATLQSLLDNAPIGICRTSLEGNCFETLNLTMRQILGGYDQQEALQLQLAGQLYADPNDRGRLLDLLRRNSHIRGFETTFRRRDGNKVPVRISGSVTQDENGEHFDGYVEDMTQQSTLEQQFRQVQKLEAVGRLAGGVAHDFNNILVVIKLSTEMMLGQITPENPLSKPLLQVSNAADRAAALTRQMLAFGRQQIMQARVINLNTVVNDTSQMLRRIIGEDVKLVTKLRDVGNTLLDPDQVVQVILNLAVNARDAMPQGGILHLETATAELDEAYARNHPPVQPGRYVMLAVSDTGTGIDKSIQTRIFDPFFTTKDLGKGTGLGLSIVYGIVKQSGGYIWVYSEAGHGTTFKLYFPVSVESVVAAPPPSESANLPSGQRVLIVEDEASIRSNVRLCLEQLGHQALEAENGESALELCTRLEGAIDLVLTDLVMPGMGGYELASAIVARYPKVKVLFMSGYTEDSAARRDILLSGSAFLQKPFSVADLSSAVRQALAEPGPPIPDA